MTHSSGSQYNFGDITGNVAAGSSNVTQNYNAGFDITKVREFADLVTEIVGLLGLEVGQQAELSAATAELHEAIEDPAADKGRMRRAVDAVMGYLKLARTPRSGSSDHRRQPGWQASSILRFATCIRSQREHPVLCDRPVPESPNVGLVDQATTSPSIRR